MADTTATARRALEARAGALAEVQGIGVELIGSVRAGAAALYEEQRNRAADEIAALGEALRRSAEALDRSGTALVTRCTEDAGRRITEFADTLRRRSFTELTDDVAQFARRWPMVFIASAVGAGLLAGRLLASPAARPAEPTQRDPSASTAPTQPSDAPLAGERRHERGAAAEHAAGANRRAG